MERVLARVLPAQELSKDELEQQQVLLRRELKQLQSEAEKLLAENSRRTAERERLVAGADAGRATAQSAQRLQLLDARLESDRIRLLALNWAQTLAQASIDAWAQRYVGLQAPDAATRQTVVTWLTRARDELENRRQLVQQLAQEARAEVREEEARIAAGTAGATTAAQQAELLAALRERSLAFERVERMGTALLRQLERWLADFGFSGSGAHSGDWRLAAAQVTETLKGIWNFEMFAVDESTIIDGKSVTVSYGVTVGKSIGALLLFLLGYWLFAALSRRLQRVMVQRFGVDQQLASVIRRWAMIALGVLLVVFILNLARIPLTVFAFLGGALAIGVGFGTQTIIKNVISGIIVLFERKIRVGDIIQLGGTTGHVVAVDLRASTVRGFDGVEALIPNSSFLENQVVNWTYSNPRIRRELRIGIAYGSPTRRAAEDHRRLRPGSWRGAQGSAAGGLLRGLRRQRAAPGAGLLGRTRAAAATGAPRGQRPALRDREETGNRRHRHPVPAARPAPRQLAAARRPHHAAGSCGRRCRRQLRARVAPHRRWRQPAGFRPRLRPARAATGRRAPRARCRPGSPAGRR
jgi:potassium efflux system protein